MVVGVAEALLPSFGILTVLCLGLMGYSLYLITTDLPQAALLAFGLADLILVPVTVWVAIKLVSRSKLSHGSSLGTGSGLEKTEAQWQSLIGETGVVEAQLRPSGKVNIRGDVYEASSGGDLLDKGEKVTVVSAVGSKIIVEKSTSG